MSDLLEHKRSVANADPVTAHEHEVVAELLVAADALVVVQEIAAVRVILDMASPTRSGNVIPVRSQESVEQEVYMSVGRICTRTVVMADPAETVREATLRMKEHNVGTIVIVDSALHPVDILTDRDVALRCVAEGKSPDEIRIQAVMSTPVHTVSEATPIEDALSTMKSRGLRRPPVTDTHSVLAGIVSMDDVVELLSAEVGDIGALLRKEAPALP